MARRGNDDAAFAGFSSAGGGAAAGSSSSSSTLALDNLGTLPSFFGSGSVDDKKYASLLEDLRAHDLLGPADVDDAATGSSVSSALGGGSSLFFNNAFSAAFLGNFGGSSSSFLADDTATTAAATATATPSRAPPPGFARAPPGLAPNETDLKWARGQQAFSQLSSSSAAAAAGGKDDAADVLDASEIPSLKALGLDDDDAAPAPPPPPSAIPPPPGAWKQQLPPPPHHQHQHQHHQHQQPQTQPPPPPPGMHQPQQHQHQPQQHQPHTQHPYAPVQGPPPPPPPHMQQHMQQHPMHMGGPPPPPPPFGMGGPPPPPPPHMAQHMHVAMHRPSLGPGGLPYPPPMLHAPPRMAPPPPVAPRFKMMTPRDIHFVAQAQTKWIRTSDPFSDDYYFHNYVQKRSRGGPVAARGGGPGGRGLPLPSWKLEHIKSVDAADSSRAAKSREWENEHHVLGRNNTKSLYRPRQLLNLTAAGGDAAASTQAAEDARPSATSDSDSQPAAATSGEGAASAAAGSSSSEESTKASSTAATHMVVKANKDVFSGELWAKRQQIDRGLQCLLSLQDARHLLDARGINVQQFHSMDAQSMDPALAELRARTTTLLLELAALLGVVVPSSSSSSSASSSDADAASTAGASAVTCDVDQLHRVLSVAKGKRLLSRALPLLHPSARFVLLPPLIEYLLSAHGVSKIAPTAAGTTARTPTPTLSDDEDERLCQTLVLTLLYHPPAPSAELLTDCLTRAMHGHDLHSLRVLLYNRGRAEALQALLQRGGAAVNEAAASDATKQQWHRSQEAFVALATAIKQAA